MEDILISKIDTLLNTFNVVSFITGLASIILAIVSLALSILFYNWGNKNNKEITALNEEIKSKTNSLNTLFDKMYNTTFKMVESQNNAMQNKLFNSIGSFESTNIVNREFEILSEITTSHNSISKKDLTQKYGIQDNELESILSKIKAKNNLISIEGDTIIFKAHNFSLSESSESLSDEAKS